MVSDSGSDHAADVHKPPGGASKETPSSSQDTDKKRAKTKSAPQKKQSTEVQPPSAESKKPSTEVKHAAAGGRKSPRPSTKAPKSESTSPKRASKPAEKKQDEDPSEKPGPSTSTGGQTASAAKRPSPRPTLDPVHDPKASPTPGRGITAEDIQVISPERVARVHKEEDSEASSSGTDTEDSDESDEDAGSASEREEDEPPQDKGAGLSFAESVAESLAGVPEISSTILDRLKAANLIPVGMDKFFIQLNQICRKNADQVAEGVFTVEQGVEVMCNTYEKWSNAFPSGTPLKAPLSIFEEIDFVREVWLVGKQNLRNLFGVAYHDWDELEQAAQQRQKEDAAAPDDSALGAGKDESAPDEAGVMLSQASTAVSGKENPHLNQLEQWMVAIHQLQKPDTLPIPDELLQRAERLGDQVDAAFTCPDTLKELSFDGFPALTVTLGDETVQIHDGNSPFRIPIEDPEPVWFRDIIKCYLANEYRQAALLNDQRSRLIDRAGGVRELLVGVTGAGAVQTRLTSVVLSQQLGEDPRPLSEATVPMVSEGTQMVDRVTKRPLHLGPQILARPDKSLASPICNHCGEGGSGRQRPCEAPPQDYLEGDKIIYPVYGRVWKFEAGTELPPAPGGESGKYAKRVEFNAPRMIVRATPRAIELTRLARLRSKGLEGEDKAPETPPVLEVTRVNMSATLPEASFAVPRRAASFTLGGLQAALGGLRPRRDSSLASHTGDTFPFEPDVSSIHDGPPPSWRLERQSTPKPATKRDRSEARGSDSEDEGVEDPAPRKRPRKGGKAEEPVGHLSPEFQEWIKPKLFAYYRPLLSHSNVLQHLDKADQKIDYNDPVSDTVMARWRFCFPTVRTSALGSTGISLGNPNKRCPRPKEKDAKWTVLLDSHYCKNPKTGEVSDRLPKYLCMDEFFGKAAITKMSTIKEDWYNEAIKEGFDLPKRKKLQVGACALCGDYMVNQDSITRHLRREHLSICFTCVCCDVTVLCPRDLSEKDAKCHKTVASLSAYCELKDLRVRDFGGHPDAANFAVPDF